MQMAKETIDRRVTRTREMLHQALMSLLLKRRYKTISIKDICHAANVGRSTFYAHYTSKDDLKRSGLETMRKTLVDRQRDAVATSGEIRDQRWRFSLGMFEHVYEYRAVNRAMLGSNAEAVVRRYIHSSLVTVVDQEVRAELRKRKRANCLVSPELLTHFVVSTFVSVMTFWLNTRNPIPPAEIDTAYRHLVLPSLASIFG